MKANLVGYSRWKQCSWGHSRVDYLIPFKVLRVSRASLGIACWADTDSATVLRLLCISWCRDWLEFSPNPPPFPIKKRKRKRKSWRNNEEINRWDTNFLVFPSQLDDVSLYSCAQKRISPESTRKKKKTLHLVKSLRTSSETLKDTLRTHYCVAKKTRIHLKSWRKIKFWEFSSHS